MYERNGELATGIDRNEVKRAERDAARQEKVVDELTLNVALHQYVDQKRRGKDGLALKARTKVDYLAMVAKGAVSKGGKPHQDGPLYLLADKPLAKITGYEMRSIYTDLATRSERRAIYAMQVLRAVLNWHGVTIEGNPLGKEVAGRDRIVLRQSAGEPNPIPPEKLGAWWRAACTIGRVGGDYYRFRLLTGTRGVEVLGDAFGNRPILVRDVDVTGARITLTDTKNRKNHPLLLSRQALAICLAQMDGKQPHEPLFAIVDPRKTLTAINEAAGVTISGHDLRDTFSSVAEDLVSSYTLKRMVNHADGGDVTGGHYIKKSEAQLRLGWQVVADFIVDAATEDRMPELVGIERIIAGNRSDEDWEFVQEVFLRLQAAPAIMTAIGVKNGR
jgi:hypothetical protein